VSEGDWVELEKLAKCLQYFHDATIATEGRTSTVDSILPTMDFLLEKLEEAKASYAEDTFMSPCCNAGWAKLDKYYSLTGRSPAYIAAMVLCPQWKWTYFDANWPEKWCAEAKKALEDFWMRQYMSTAVSLPILTETSNKPVENAFLKWQAGKKKSPHPQDEYVQYIRTPTIDVTDARSWWLEPTQRKTYPNLSLMALDLLSIPAMSAEPERLFSSAKITITDRRNRLGIESIEAVECLKSWLGNSVAYMDGSELSLGAENESGDIQQELE
jgi:hypothetical protein